MRCGMMKKTKRKKTRSKKARNKKAKTKQKKQNKNNEKRKADDAWEKMQTRKHTDITAPKDR